jgi:hypothetical protein
VEAIADKGKEVAMWAGGEGRAGAPQTPPREEAEVARRGGEGSGRVGGPACGVGGVAGLGRLRSAMASQRKSVTAGVTRTCRCIRVPDN